MILPCLPSGAGFVACGAEPEGRRRSEQKESQNGHAPALRMRSLRLSLMEYASGRRRAANRQAPLPFRPRGPIPRPPPERPLPSRLMSLQGPLDPPAVRRNPTLALGIAAGIVLIEPELVLPRCFDRLHAFHYSHPVRRVATNARARGDKPAHPSPSSTNAPAHRRGLRHYLHRPFCPPNSRARHRSQPKYGKLRIRPPTTDMTRESAWKLRAAHERRTPVHPFVLRSRFFYAIVTLSWT